MVGQNRLKGVQFSEEPPTSGRVRAPVPTLLATHSRGNHGGIAPTNIGESANGKRRRSRPLQP
ncbi:hypothetical protein [Prochlorothrix hollandica]|uniref:hypothetical protein n=1 Tax=Prochlorothrix hollandica TaxID=1223 RepID=UPI00333EE0BE